MTTLFALLGVQALWLLYLWLLSAIVASYLSGRKGYGERVGLASGLLLNALGAIIWLFIPAEAGIAVEEGRAAAEGPEAQERGLISPRRARSAAPRRGRGGGSGSRAPRCASGSPAGPWMMMVDISP